VSLSSSLFLRAINLLFDVTLVDLVDKLLHDGIAVNESILWIDPAINRAVKNDITGRILIILQRIYEQ